MFTPSSQSIRFFVSLVILTAVGGCAIPGVITPGSDSDKQGLTLYKAGDYSNAVGAFQNAIHQEPRDHRNYYYLACCYEQLKDYQKAITNYRAALDVMKLTLAGREDAAFRPAVLDGLASAIAKSDHRNTEIDSMERQVRGVPNLDTCLVLAKVYRYTGDADSAISAYNRAALMDSKSPAILKEYGLYMEKLGQTQKAETPLRKAYLLDPNDKEIAAALRRLGVVPGPAIKDEKDLVQPIMPKGPIPDVPGI